MRLTAYLPGVQLTKLPALIQSAFSVVAMVTGLPVAGVSFVWTVMLLASASSPTTVMVLPVPRYTFLLALTVPARFSGPKLYTAYSPPEAVNVPLTVTVPSPVLYRP